MIEYKYVEFVEDPSNAFINYDNINIHNSEHDASSSYGTYPSITHALNKYGEKNWVIKSHTVTSGIVRDCNIFYHHFLLGRQIKK